jgi:hypothetical protein
MLFWLNTSAISFQSLFLNAYRVTTYDLQGPQSFPKQTTAWLVKESSALCWTRWSLNLSHGTSNDPSGGGGKKKKKNCFFASHDFKAIFMFFSSVSRSLIPWICCILGMRAKLSTYLSDRIISRHTYHFETFVSHCRAIYSARKRDTTISSSQTPGLDYVHGAPLRGQDMLTRNLIYHGQYA